MIQIKLRDDKWRLHIGAQDAEIWEFKTREEMFAALSKLMDLKEMYGKLEDKRI